MENISNLDEFFNTSLKIGSNWFLSQANGGNTSIKFNNDLLIKASGTSLFQEKDKIKNIFVYKSKASQFKKPSMEWPIHQLLPNKYIFHYHSIRFIACSILSQTELVKEHLTNKGIKSVVIEYIEPGKDLANSIKEVFLKDKSYDIFLLDNHGVVISSNNISYIEKICFDLEKILLNILSKLNKNYFDIEKLISSEPKIMRNLRSIKLSKIHYESFIKGLENISSKGSLFPDQFLYLGEINKIFNNKYKNYKKSIFRLTDSEIKFESFNATKTIIREYSWVTFILILIIGSSEKSNNLKLISNDLSAALIKNPDEIFRKKLGVM